MVQARGKRWNSLAVRNQCNPGALAAGAIKLESQPLCCNQSGESHSAKLEWKLGPNHAAELVSRSHCIVVLIKSALSWRSVGVSLLCWYRRCIIERWHCWHCCIIGRWSRWTSRHAIPYHHRHTLLVTKVNWDKNERQYRFGLVSLISQGFVYNIGRCNILRSCHRTCL